MPSERDLLWRWPYSGRKMKAHAQRHNPLWRCLEKGVIPDFLYLCCRRWTAAHQRLGAKPKLKRGRVVMGQAPDLPVAPSSKERNVDSVTRERVRRHPGILTSEPGFSVEAVFPLWEKRSEYLSLPWAREVCGFSIVPVSLENVSGAVEGFVWLPSLYYEGLESMIVWTEVSSTKSRELFRAIAAVDERKVARLTGMRERAQSVLGLLTFALLLVDEKDKGSEELRRHLKQARKKAISDLTK